MNAIKEKKLNVLGETLWLDILKTSRALFIFLLLATIVSGGLGIAIIAPWGRASPDCSIYCVLMNKLKDPIQWSDLQLEMLNKKTFEKVEGELDALDLSFKMPNYKQHGVWLNKVQYESLVYLINQPISERKNPLTGEGMNIIEDIYFNMNSKEYSLLRENNNIAGRINKLKEIFEKRKNLILKSQFNIERPKYEVAAKEGNADAQYKLALMYYKGSGYVQDYKEAIKWYTKAAEHGHSAAMFNLASMYYEGDVVSQDYQIAAKWYKRAAERQHPRAQYKLGLMYYKGYGVAQSKELAEKWWKLSANQGLRAE